MDRKKYKGITVNFDMNGLGSMKYLKLQKVLRSLYEQEQARLLLEKKAIEQQRSILGRTAF